jgi:hypothetical protein
MNFPHTHTHTHTHIHTLIHTCIHIHIYMYMCECIYMCEGVCGCVCVCVYVCNTFPCSACVVPKYVTKRRGITAILPEVCVLHSIYTYHKCHCLLAHFLSIKNKYIYDITILSACLVKFIPIPVTNFKPLCGCSRNAVQKARHKYHPEGRNF